MYNEDIIEEWLSIVFDHEIIDNNNRAHEYTNPMAIRDAPKEVLDNERFISMVVMEDGRALQYASKRLQNNKKIVLIALFTYNQYLLSFYRYCSNLKNKISEQYNNISSNISNELLNDSDVILELNKIKVLC